MVSVYLAYALSHRQLRQDFRLTVSICCGAEGDEAAQTTEEGDPGNLPRQSELDQDTTRRKT